MSYAELEVFYCRKLSIELKFGNLSKSLDIELDGECMTSYYFNFS
jgi:hypothetical protein